MNYLVSWTGGIDSTFLIYHLLEQGHSVEAVYTELLNNKHQTTREKDAINSMKSLFVERYDDRFKYVEHTNIFNLQNVSTTQLILPQLHILLLNLIMASHDKIDEVCIGYVMNDDAISYLDDIQNAWNSFLVYNIPKLTFPLTKFNKTEIIRDLPEEFLKKCSWCECPDKLNPGIVGCGECSSCKRLLYIEQYEFNRGVPIKD